VLIVGELINSTRKQARELLQARDAGGIVQLASRQLNAGAHLVDVNCAALMADEADCLEWAVRTIQAALDVRICIDSPSPVALRRALAAHRGKAMLNSITLEQERWSGLLPLARAFRPSVVALCMDDRGAPPTAEGRLEIATALVDGLTDAGIPTQDIYVDPLVFPVATDANAVTVFLRAAGLIRERLPDIHIICGLSNVSFGLPLRSQINQVFLVLCLAQGIDAFILDPLDSRLMANMVTAQMLLGQDEFCQSYLAAVRAGKFDVIQRRSSGGSRGGCLQAG